MRFDAELHRCTLIIDKDLPPGLAMNAASVVGISFGRAIENLVGAALQSQDGVFFPGVITAPLPVLLASGDYLRELHQRSAADETLFAMPFSALAQSCRSYDEYEPACATPPVRKSNWWRWAWRARKKPLPA